MKRGHRIGVQGNDTVLSISKSLILALQNANTGVCEAIQCLKEIDTSILSHVVVGNGLGLGTQ